MKDRSMLTSAKSALGGAELKIEENEWLHDEGIMNQGLVVRRITTKVKASKKQLC